MTENKEKAEFSEPVVKNFQSGNFVTATEIKYLIGLSLLVMVVQNQSKLIDFVSNKKIESPENLQNTRKARFSRFFPRKKVGEIVGCN